MMMKDIIPFYNASDKLLVKSKDCYQYDSDGKQYIDFESGVWCTNIGHSNDQLIQRITSQLNDSIHHGYRFRNEYAEQLSKKLQHLIGFENGSSVFLSSGSEAVNLSITLSRHLTGRKKILKIDNSYLSAYGFGQMADDNQSIVTVKFNDWDSIAAIDFSEIAAFVVETGGASVEMVRFPDIDFIKKLVKISLANHCLIIAEEVTTGIGRMGKWFGFQYYDITPDIVVTGKALGNGFPISAMIINSNTAARFEHSPFRYAQSHQNDPLGCVIGLEVIKIIEENKLIDHCNLVGKYFKSQLDRIKNKHTNKVHDVRARGLMLAMELNKCVNGELISNQLFENGFVIGFKINTLRFLPPLCIKENDIDQLIERLDVLLSEQK